MTMLAQSLLGFLPPRESSQDFGWAFAGSNGGADRLNGVGAYDQTATVKPIADIGLGGDPLQVIGPRVEPVLVLVVDDGEVEGVRNEGIGHKSVYEECLRGPILGQFGLGVAATIQSSLHESPTDVSGLSVSVIDNSIHTEDAPEIAYSVEPLVSANVLPLFSGQKRDVVFLGLGEGINDRSLKVELVGLSPVWTKPCNQEPIVERGLEHPCLSVTPAVRLPRESSNSMAIRDFVEFLKIWDWAPNLAEFLGKLNRLIRENLVRKSVYVNALLHPVTRQHGPRLIQAQNCAGSWSQGSPDLFGARKASYAPQIRDFVKTFVARNRAPLLNRIFHWFAPVVSIGVDISKVSQWLCQSLLVQRHLYQNICADQMVSTEVSRCRSH